MVIGVCGGYCSGKDTVVGVLASRGWDVVDVDRLGHDALETKRRVIADRFGGRVLAGGGGIDRKALGQVVFGDPGALSDLESIVHPSMVAEVDERLRIRGRHCVINAAILYRMGLHTRCDLILCVRAPLLLRFLRAQRRDGASLRRFLRLLRSQRGICSNPKGLRVDTYTVCNAAGIRALERRVGTLVARYDRPSEAPER